MNQGGVKHASEPTRLDNKRERRRGAAGRAAALRRAPSDSDCSGETASLSADSGDRALRPAPPPPRTTKSRSRRRGSEWEVLEGLKDGQRFEKRPEVFNGYLHKKRKWPLKGWHKRFFVVDGGILVYARSPTDVARGRLHGSVDVGLSVISAKARRRRIDIDADEFIYHLRAKTVDVFRTWLNVLKAHRLYRQHLLTFGARESVPKIHAPLDDQPPTDTSSRTSSVEFSTSSSSEDVESVSQLTGISVSQKTCNTEYSYNDTVENPSRLLSSNIKHSDDIIVNNGGFFTRKHKSLCSMNCVALRFVNKFKRKAPVNVSRGSTDAEKQMLTADLDIISKRSTDTRIQSTLTPNAATKDVSIKHEDKQIPSVFHSRKVEPTTAYFFFTKKKPSDSTISLMRKSKKSTNLVKYRNLTEEPTLKRPLSKCVLLGKYKIKVPKKVETMRSQHRATVCDPVAQEDDSVQMKAHKSLQDMMTTSEYDHITERLMMSVFHNYMGEERGDEMKYYVNQIIKDLYDVQITSNMNPIKALFRGLLEYWLKNTSMTFFKDAMRNVKSVSVQSNLYFTKDENLSSRFVGLVNKGTQFHGLSEPIVHYYKKHGGSKPLSRVTKVERKRPPKCNSPKRDTESFEKERRIQELERLLKSTVYVCETSQQQSKEKDIKITKTLIDNIGKFSRRPDVSKTNENPEDHSNSSTELPEIQETINHLISETSIPPDVAKEFLSAYLDVLLHDGSRSDLSSQSSEQSIEERDKENLALTCEVNAESVVKRVSKSVTTLKDVEIKKELDNKSTIVDKNLPVDPGQLYLKDILDKITTIFSKVTKVDDKNWQNITNEKPSAVKADVKDELGRPVKENAGNNLIYENCDENAVVIDLSKYDLEHISMLSDPAIKGIMSITIKLKEKPPNFGESKKNHMSLKFSDEAKPLISGMKSDHWISYVNPSDSAPTNIFKKRPIPSTFMEFSGVSKDFIELKPYLSSTDATPGPFEVIHESAHSIDVRFKSSKSFHKEPNRSFDANDETQSCYVMSLKKGTLNKFQSKKKVKLKECKGIVISPKTNSSDVPERCQHDLTVFDRPAPRVIDEKFILLLLENLSLLSKNVPSLHKDISNLYVKLKKKHEKVIRNCSTIQGLSLLGKIYNEESCNKTTGENETQFEANVQTTFKTVQTLKEVKHVLVNTSKCYITEMSVDEALSTDASELISTLIQTEDVIFKMLPQVVTSRNEIIAANVAQISSTNSLSNIIEITDRGTSNSNWFTQLTRECAVSTIIKSVLESGSTHDFRIPRPELRRCERDHKKKKQSPRVRQNLIDEITLLSPSFKVSTQSQTQKIRLVRDTKKLEKDFKVYQLFLNVTYEPTKSSSVTIFNANTKVSDDMKTLYRCSSDPSYCSGLISPTSPPLRGPQAGFVSGTPGGRLASWIVESGGPLESVSRELGQAQLSVQQLQRLLDSLELHHQAHHDTDVSLEGASPNVKKDRRKFGLRKKKSNSKCASVELQPANIDLSSSHMALSALTAPPSPGGGSSSVPNSAASLPIACAAARPQSLPAAESLATGPASLSSLTPDHQLREDFTVLAKDLVASLKTVLTTMVCERGRLRAAMEAADGAATPGGPVMVALRSNLSTALQQNSVWHAELRSRLSRIHDASDLAEISSVGANSDAAARQFQQSLSYSSSCVSASEFFDAEEYDDDAQPTEIIAADEAGVIELDGDSSSEAGSLSSEEGSASSDNSDVLSAEQVTLRVSSEGGSWSRRTRLAAPRASPAGPSLWNLLYKNIGKDLSQISMPVTINEPLNMLQRLCEELEYSELLESAAGCGDPMERMALVAAFAVSSYAASAHRAASKPFNPLLAETYECVRSDRGFRFLAEQVSHHPPISACHAEAGKWCFWQEARIKTKFWGKSMEFQPAGRVHVRLNTTGDHYTWNKVTTCVHNLFGGQRWVDQYGEMQIVAHGTDITCKLNFVKASSWSGSRHEVRGAVCGGGARLRLAGRWSEALYAGDPPAARLLWRPGAMPPEHEIYYGFTRFAMELNELEPGMREVLPHTDTRLRPDQRALEEGDVEGAERHKLRLEQAQRERRRDHPLHTPAWFRKALEDGEEMWVFSGEYWKAREAGFGEATHRIW